MPEALAASILDSVLGLEIGATGQDAANRVALEGLTLAGTPGGALEIKVRKLEATSLRLASGALAVEVGRVALHQLAAQVLIGPGSPRLVSLQAAHAELTAVRVQGPFAIPRQARPAAGSSDAAAQPGDPPWCIGPLATADGTIRAEIVDAHLLFDAHVTVPIRQGLVDFNAASVEHVGPDSRMGVSRLGLYVDAPNGRSYLYQFPAAPLAGVEFERRGALLGPRVTDRGRLRLQPFVEGLLRQGERGPGVGVTEQARLLLDRTALSGEVRLSDGRVAAFGAQAELAGRAEGRNAVHLRSQAVGRGLTLEMASLFARRPALRCGETQVEGDELTGVLMLRLFAEGGQLRFALDLGSLRISGLRVHPRPSRSA